MTTTEQEVQALFDENSEQSLLGCVLMGNANANARAFHEAGELVQATTFYRPAHQTIWRTLDTMASQGKPLELPALIAELRQTGELDQVQGAPYLLELQGKGITPGNASYYAEKVRQVATRRAGYQAAVSMRQIFLQGTGDMTALVEAADDQWAAVHTSADSTVSSGAKHFGKDMLAHVIDDLSSSEDPMGVTTGFADLDAALLGLHAGELIVVGARPGAGKTTLGLNLITSAVKAGHRSLFVSLEMNEREIGQRLLSAHAGINLSVLRGKFTSEEDWEIIARKQPEMSDWPLLITDDPSLTFAQIKAEIRRQHRQGLDLVVIDYLQLLQDPESKSADTREREVALMTRGLKILAQQLSIPIVVLCQLNRDSARREDTRPRTHELRESGAVEQDANVVILIHREDLDNKDSPRSGEADLIISKNRNGPTCDVTVAFQGHLCRFFDMAQG